MIIREEYLKKIIHIYGCTDYKKFLPEYVVAENPIILEMLHKELISKGIDESNIICKRYTSFEIDDCYTAKDMYNDIKKK